MSSSPPEQDRPGATVPGVSALGDALYHTARKIGAGERGLTYAAMRYVKIVARDPATYTVSIALNDDDEADPNLWVPGTRIGNPAYYPRVGDVGVALQNRSDYVIMGAINGEVGHVRLQGATDVTMEPTPASNVISWQTEIDDNDALWSSGTNITIPWPGIWDVYAGVEVNGGSAVHRRILDLLVGATRLDRDELPHPGGGVGAIQSLHVGAHRVFAAGNVLTVEFNQTGGGNETLEERTEDTPTFNATWLGRGTT